MDYLGLESEKDKLPCFVNETAFYKPECIIYLEMIRKLKPNEKKSQQLNINKENFRINNLSELFIDPLRKEIILGHRWNYKNINSSIKSVKESLGLYVMKQFHVNAPKESKVNSLIGLKPIFLRDIDYHLDKVYEGYLLSVINIDVITFMSSILLVVQDENKDVQRLTIYGLTESEEEIIRKYPFGSHSDY